MSGKPLEELSQTAPRRDYRYERKYFVENLDAHQVIGLLKRHPALFGEIYPPRQINNIYLDTPLLENFADNINGSPGRQKARIRWYHQLFQQIESPVLEFKIKRGWMGTKLQYALPGFEFQTGFTPACLADLVQAAVLPPDIKVYLKSVEPVLLNSYLRWYFATPDRRYRVTVDSDLSFYHLHHYQNTFRYRRTHQRSIVVELKYSRENDPGASRISAGFPFRMTRSSKYVQGIERVYL